MNHWFRAKNEQELISHIKKETPSLYLQSRTSTVIDYNTIENYAINHHLTLVDLSLLKPHMEWKDDEKIKIKGAKEIEDIVLSLPQLKSFLGDKPIKKVIVVPKKIVNIVL